MCVWYQISEISKLSKCTKSHTAVQLTLQLVFFAFLRICAPFAPETSNDSIEAWLGLIRRLTWSFYINTHENRTTVSLFVFNQIRSALKQCFEKKRRTRLPSCFLVQSCRNSRLLPPHKNTFQKIAMISRFCCLKWSFHFAPKRRCFTGFLKLCKSWEQSQHETRCVWNRGHLLILECLKRVWISWIFFMKIKFFIFVAKGSQFRALKSSEFWHEVNGGGTFGVKGFLSFQWLFFL